MQSDVSQPNFLITTVDSVFNWAPKSSLWPMTFGTACCFVEFATAATARFDIARFGRRCIAPHRDRPT
jgi:NADH:ubiquinone oxidoreductase subunit B-like Fe-S oxidoreductase